MIYQIHVLIYGEGCLCGVELRDVIRTKLNVGNFKNKFPKKFRILKYTIE